MKSMKLVPSILNANFANLEKEIKTVEMAGIEALHIDVMDGQFVPNITFGPSVVSSIHSITNLSLDIHLMIIQPENYIDQFIEAGANTINVHQESTPNIYRCMQMIKDKGARAGIVLNPGTSIDTIIPILHLVDQILIMTVNPGFGGQTFIDFTLKKIAELSELKKLNGYHYEIEVDGGIIPETALLCKKAGATMFVSGSYIYDANDPRERIAALMEVLD